MPLKEKERNRSRPLARSTDVTFTRWDRREMDALVREFARTRDPFLRERIILGNEGLVRYVVARFKPSGCIAQEDLLQVGRMGLIGALERFDLNAGVPFLAFAVPTMIGTLKHYLRDHAWTVQAPRRLRELGMRSRRMREELAERLGRPPMPFEIAAALEVSEERLLEAMDLDQCFLMISLDCREGEDGAPHQAALDSLGELDPAMTQAETIFAIRQAMATMDDRLQQIIRSRFFGEATQMEVAQALGISQMHVSRLERKALQLLREALH